MPVGTCGSCRFFERYDYKQGWCHAHPPSVLKAKAGTEEMPGGDFHNVILGDCDHPQNFPCVKVDGWCGEWKELE